MDTTLGIKLGTLESNGLIRVSQTLPDLEYYFRHGLSQEAAYGSLLKQDRRRLHLSVGHFLERALGDRAADFAPILGRHFDEGGDEARAIAYLTHAADAASKRYALSEGVMLYDEALDVARRGESHNAEVASIIVRRGRLLEMSGRYAAALDSYSELVREAQRTGDEPSELQGLMAAAAVYCAPTSMGNVERGEQTTRRALELSRALGDRAAEARVLWLLVLLKKFSGHMEDALVLGEQSVAISRELGLKELLAYTLNDLFPAYITLGKVSDAIAVLTESEQLFRQLDLKPLLADVLVNLTELNTFRGDLERAHIAADEAYDIAAHIDNAWGIGYSSATQGMLHHEFGLTAEAIRWQERAIQFSERAGFAIGQTMARGMLGWVYSDLGDTARGLSVAREGYALAQKIIPFWAPQVQAMMVMCAARAGELEFAERELAVLRPIVSPQNLSSLYAGLAEAEFALKVGEYETLLQSIAEYDRELRTFSFQVFIADVELFRARALLALGRWGEADAAALRGIASAQAIGSRRILWWLFALRLEIDRARTDGARGNAEALDQMRQRARDEIAFFADNAPDESRASFLALPEVRSVM